MNILEEIAEKRRMAVEEQRKRIALEKIKERALIIAKREWERDGGFLFPFYNSLQGEMHFICEVKKASPSKGIISEEFPYVEKALVFEEAGASAISVLTEPEYFLGKNEHLEEIAKCVTIPILRKDFVVDVYQIYEAKVLGASAVLLICMLLTDEQLEFYLQLCHMLGLSALVETHDAKEVKRALNAGASIIGVNNRDLKDFTVDIQTSIRLRRLVPKEVVFVSESGIKNAKDIQLLRKHEVNAVLIGETLMCVENVKETFKELVGD